MPYSCPVCDNENYTEIDGYFFCTECQTQSQELIVQEASATTNSDFRFQHEVKLSIKDKSSLKGQKPDCGRPWTIYEAYQIIIQSQVEALITLGAREELKDVVFTIWANYLSKLGVAFCKKEKLVPDVVLKTRVGRRRELYRGTLNNPLNRCKRPFIQQHDLICKPAEDNIMNDLDEDFHNEDKPDDDSESEDIVFVNESESIPGWSSRASRRSRAKHSNEWMNMDKTIALCYIGLMFTDPNILPLDVVRFVHEGKVPYLLVTHLLPTDMVLSSKDQSLFKSGRFDKNTFVTEINRLLNYLKLDNMPTADLDVIIPRFIEELCLPGEFVSICYCLMEKVPFVWFLGRKICYRKHEIIAASYIILAVKIALGLDDSTEIKLSKYSQEVHRQISSGKKPFVWTNWKNFVMRKAAHEFSAYGALTSDISKSGLQHVDQLLECYFTMEPGKRKLPVRVITKNKKHSVRGCKTDVTRSVVKPLEVALERLEHEIEETGHMCSISSDSACEDKQVWNTVSQEFHSSTMNHLVNVDVLKKQVRQLSPEKEAKLSKLLKKFSVPRREVVQYSVVCDHESLMSSRHESYLWLLQYVCQQFGCSVMEVDKIVVHLLKFLLDFSNGETNLDQVCCEIGAVPLTDKIIKKMTQRWYDFHH